MKGRTFVAIAFSLAGSVVLGPGCAGSDGSGGIGGTDAGDEQTAVAEAGGSGGDGAATECTIDADCTAKLPETTPPGCAEATCDTLLKKCHFKARDADGDGHTAKACAATTATIETGNDCDDNDPNTYPGAWDGPASASDAGPGVEPDRCDQRDNDCNGSPDDGNIPVDGGIKTCKCDPTAPLPCYEYPSGVPIDPTTLDNNNVPKGACKKGLRSCVAGVPQACNGAVGPSTEQCDDLDHDCNGQTGNGGQALPTAPVWYKDSDNDNFGDQTVAPKQQCVTPGTGWKNIPLPNTDCNDADPQVNPGLAEVCDGKDNNCNGSIDEGGVLSTFCADADGDHYCTATCVQACAAPAGYRQQSTCLAGTDCNDGNAAIHPGASEACGDGVDSNCDGNDSDGYANLGMGCTSGTFGVCRRAGTFVCNAAHTGTQCSVSAGTATSGNTVPSSDPLIDMSQARAGYDPRWDWNCDNNVVVQTALYDGSFRASACGGSYESACNTLGASDSSCNAGVFFAKFFNCTEVNFFWYGATDNRQCGNATAYIGCDNFASGTTCDYLANTYTVNGNVSCN